MSSFFQCFMFLSFLWKYLPKINIWSLLRFYRHSKALLSVLYTSRGVIMCAKSHYSAWCVKLPLGACGLHSSAPPNGSLTHTQLYTNGTPILLLQSVWFVESDDSINWWCRKVVELQLDFLNSGMCDTLMD